MMGVLVRATFLVQSLFLIVQATQSPCPNYFRYKREESTHELLGHIEIPSPPKRIALHLKVALSLPASLPSKYVGRLELAQSREESVKAVKQGRPLKYRIHFPLRNPIPLLTGLWFNNEQFCVGPRAMGPIVTSIVLEHTFYPPGVLPLSEVPGNAIPSPPSIENTPSSVPPPSPSPRPSPSPTTPPPPPLSIFPNINTNNQEECGRSNVNTINPLIARGVKTSPGQWPWLTAIFVVKIEFEFQCAGSLVTNKHIITAAHCFKLEDQNLPPSALLVSVGRYRLRDWREKGSVNREVAEYRNHPDYRHQGSADSDLAIVILRESVEYSTVIKPLCLWSGSTKLQSVVGKSGYVVGWGRDEFGNPYVAEPRMTKVPIVSQEDCLWSNANFVAFTSNRTFCAGSRNGSGPCNGDSGSGLVIYDINSARYQLRGIVSRSLLDSSTMSCDLTQYVVYVDVAKHLDWIREQISK